MFNYKPKLLCGLMTNILVFKNKSNDLLFYSLCCCCQVNPSLLSQGSCSLSGGVSRVSLCFIIPLTLKLQLNTFMAFHNSQNKCRKKCSAICAHFRSNSVDLLAEECHTLSLFSKCPPCYFLLFSPPRGLSHSPPLLFSCSFKINQHKAALSAVMLL